MIKIEKKDGIDVVVNSELPGWTRPASADEVALYAHIAELERRLYDCENAVLLRHDAAVAAYYLKYPTPIEKPALATQGKRQYACDFRDRLFRQGDIHRGVTRLLFNLTVGE